MNVQQMHNDGEAARRRLVVIHSLRDLLSPPEQQEALGLWDRSFAQSRAFAVVSFVSKLDELLGLGARASAIQRSLSQRMFMREEELTASATGGGTARSWGDPSNIATTAPESARATAPRASTPAAVVFGDLLTGVVRRIARRLDGEPTALARGLKRGLGGIALGAEARRAVSAWCETTLVSSTLDLHEVGDMKAVMHAIYLFACDTFGPTLADRIFSDAIRAAEELPEASRFSPRKLF